MLFLTSEFLPKDRYIPFITDPSKAVFPLLPPKYSRNDGKNSPNVKQTPSTRKLIMNDDRVTTHPHPPSGGKGTSESHSSSSVRDSDILTVI